MTIISNPFSLACRLLLSKYTISTLQSIDIADNQDSYERIWKFSRFQRVKKERSKRFSLCPLPATRTPTGLLHNGLQSQNYTLILNSVPNVLKNIF